MPPEIQDLLQSIEALMQYIEQNGANLDQATQQELGAFLQESMQFVEEYQQEAQQPQPMAQPQGVDLLWILSGGDENAFVDYLRTYPGTGFKQLAANPHQLASVIQHLQQNNPIEQVPSPDGIPNTQYPSSNVAGMKYDPKSGKLLVKFHGEGREPVYQYDGVPPQIFKLLEHGNAFAKTKGKNKWGEWWPMKNPSIGASVNEYLKKGGYPYRKVS